MARTLLVWILALCVPAAAAHGAMRLIVLGSGGPGAFGRAASCHVIEIDGTPRILVDAGPGCFVRIGESKLSLAALDIVLLTHLHADHAGDLPGLFKARAVSSRGPVSFAIYGPAGGGDFPATSHFVDLLFGRGGAFAYLADFSAPLQFRVTDLKAAPHAGDKPKTIFSEQGLTIRAIAGHHGDAPAVIYRVDHQGKSLVFTGDIDSKGHGNLRKIAADASVLVFNSVVLDPPESPRILYSLHTAPADIGALAQDVRAERLVLAHLSPATDGHRDAVARSILKRYQGRIEFAEDGMNVDP